jgi:hypothetical protein
MPFLLSSLRESPPAEDERDQSPPLPGEGEGEENEEKEAAVSAAAPAASGLVPPAGDLPPLMSSDSERSGGDADGLPPLVSSEAEGGANLLPPLVSSESEEDRGNNLPPLVSSDSERAGSTGDADGLPPLVSSESEERTDPDDRDAPSSPAGDMDGPPPLISSSSDSDDRHAPSHFFPFPNGAHYFVGGADGLPPLVSSSESEHDGSLPELLSSDEDDDLAPPPLVSSSSSDDSEVAAREPARPVFAQLQLPPFIDSDARKITRDFLSVLVTQDALHRRARQFPLVTTRTLFRLSSMYGNYGFAEDVLITNPSFEPQLNVTGRPRRDAIVLFNKLSKSFRSLGTLLARVKRERIQSGSDVELVISGGAVAGMLFGERTFDSNSDLDIFFVSPSGDTEAASRLLRLLLDSFEGRADSQEVDTVMLNRSEHCTSINFVDYGYGVEKYQFIHRLYPSAASVVGGFDLPCCGVMLHGPELDELSMTHLAAWSLALRIIIVDTTRRSKSYPYRLKKYERRGFRIIFPGADPSIAQDTADVHLKDVMFHRISGKLRLGGREADEHDYADSYFHDAIDIQEFPYVYLAQNNFFQALAKQPENIVGWCSADRGFAAADGSRRSLSSLVEKDLDVGVHRVRSFVGKTTPTSTQTYYASPAPTTGEIYLRRFGDPDVAAEYAVADIRGDKDRCLEIEKETVARVEAMLEKQRARVSEVLWRTENPGEQWTGSFNPILEDPRDFYTPVYYTPFRVYVCDYVFVTMMRLARLSEFFQDLPSEVLLMIATSLMDGVYNDALFHGYVPFDDDDDDDSDTDPDIRRGSRVCPQCGAVHSEEEEDDDDDSSSTSDDNGNPFGGMLNLFARSLFASALGPSDSDEYEESGGYGDVDSDDDDEELRKRDVPEGDVGVPLSPAPPHVLQQRRMVRAHRVVSPPATSPPQAGVPTFAPFQAPKVSLGSLGAVPGPPPVGPAPKFSFGVGQPLPKVSLPTTTQAAGAPPRAVPKFSFAAQSSSSSSSGSPPLPIRSPQIWGAGTTSSAPPLGPLPPAFSPTPQFHFGTGDSGGSLPPGVARGSPPPPVFRFGNGTASSPSEEKE